MKKSFITLLLAFVMLLPAPAAWAEIPSAESGIELTKAEQEKITLLYKIGIIDNAEVTDDSVTRGEFATWLARLSGLDSNLLQATTNFEDVSASNKYAGAVTVVSAIGCMKGISEKEFGVNKNISRLDATVALLRLLGYETVAKKDGGYPDGYAKYAATLGLNKGIAANEENDRIAILLMCYNSLTTVFVDSDGEVRKDNLLIKKIHNVYETKGVVTANRFTKLDSEKGALKPNEIAIDDTIYITEDVSLAEHIGEYVSCYYSYNERDDERYIVYMKELSNFNDKLVLTHKEILSAKNNVITYEDEKGETKKANLRGGFDFILNNRVVLDRTTADLAIEDGELTLIDSDGDELYDLVKAKSIETMIFRGADNIEDLIYCKEGNIHTKPFDDSYYCEIIRVNVNDGSQERISIDEMSQGDVLTVYRSRDSKYLLIYAYSSGVYGVINEINDEQVIVDGTAYELPLKTPRSELSVGAKVSFSVDMFGRLVYLERETDELGPQYGYFFAYDGANGLGNAKVKIIVGNDVFIYSLAEIVKVDDAAAYSGRELNKCASLFEGGAAKRQLVRYCLNGKDEVTAFYTAYGNSENSIKKTPGFDKNVKTNYYPWHKVIAEKYVMPDDSFFLVIPNANEEEAANEELYSINYSFADYVNSCYLELYDVNDDMQPGAVLLYANNSLEGSVPTNQNSPVGIVVKTAVGVDNNIVYLWDDGETKAYEVNGDTIPSLEPYQFGDVVRYELNKDGKVVTLSKMMDIGTTPEDTPVPTLHQEGNIYHYFGRVHKKLEEYLVMIPNRENPGFVDADVDKRVVVPSADIRNCAVVDMKTKKVVTGSYDSISQYFEGEESGGCYIYTSLYMWYCTFDLIIYKF